MNIKFLLSDLDGVIRHYPAERSALIEKNFGLPTGAIHSAAFEKGLLSKAVCGAISDELWRAEISKSLAKSCGQEVADSVIREWSDFSGFVDNEYLAHIESRFAGIPIAVLTNGTSRLKSDLNKLGIERRFHRIFKSAEIGVCKPDKKIYAHVVDKLGCNPADVLFVDDSISHVKSAQEFGMIAHHYVSLDEFQAAFSR